METTFQKIIKNLKNPFNSPTIAKYTFGQFRRVIRSYCPICGCGSSSLFISFGIPRRANAFCPSCGSVERHRFIWLCLENEGLLRQTEQLSLLHFAPEKCFVPRFEKIFGIGYMTGDIELGRAKMVVDITNICFESESHNYIVCNHVLEHIPDDYKALKELYRVLKKDGTAFLSVPIKGEITDEDLSIADPDERTKRFGQFDHVRYYGMDFKTRIESVGFQVSVITPKDVIKNERLRELFGINVTEGSAGNIVFVSKKI
jgi:SAM-dependent methyltransferase